MSNARVIAGDCLDVLRGVPDGSVALVVTSPPYADAREQSYGGITPDAYAEWFAPRAVEFKRLLAADGTFILNIKERVVAGVRHRYVRDLLDLMEESGWLFTEEWIWHKKNTAPGKWPNRFRDAWEHLFQFNVRRNFYMDQDAVRVPVGGWAKGRLSRLSAKDRTRDSSATGSHFAKDVSKWVGRDTVYPSNVLHLASECRNQGHSAVFPVALPDFFIRLFSKEGDLVLDPFCGSGTTGVAAVRLRRRFLGVEIVAAFSEASKRRIAREGGG